jgi:hypothetical protein
MFAIQILRRWDSDDSTLSTLSIPEALPGSGELASGFILERPGPDTTQSGQRLRIPDGVYKMQWAVTSATPSLNKQAPLPWIYNTSVPAARMIYIHHGNFPRDTDGCLLIGSGRAEDMVTGSVPALKKLKVFLNRVGVENIEVRINSHYYD